MISNLKWESLEQRRAKSKTVLMYKTIHVHNLVEIRAEHLLIPSDCRTRGIAAFRAIHEQMYVTFLSSLVPLSLGTAYHQKYVRPVTGRARVHYPSHALPDVNSAPPCF